jgi:hypothetical protein
MDTYTAKSHIAATPAALQVGGVAAPTRLVRDGSAPVAAVPRAALHFASAWRPLLLSAVGLAALLYCSWKSGW